MERPPARRAQRAGLTPIRPDQGQAQGGFGNVPVSFTDG
jgi:hypothetical protein